MIFKLAMGTRRIQIISRKAPKRPGGNPYELCYRNKAAPKGLRKYSGTSLAYEIGRPLEQLHLTCRPIYLETYLLPYSVYLFSFVSQSDFHDWVTGLLTEQRGVVKTLTLPKYHWRALCESHLEELQGLKTLYLAGSDLRIQGMAIFNKGRLVSNGIIGIHVCLA